MIRDIKVGNRVIGPNSEPFVIAEMSGNHNQSLDRALEIVDAAAATGAHALKLQTYTADTMTLDVKDDNFFINDPNSLWHGNSLYELYQKAYTPWEWHKPIYDRCKEHGMICFSTPFDATAVDFLEELDNPIYKIASFENIDIPLLKKVAETKKPVIVSTGLANLNEISDIVRTLRECGCEDIILLKCTSAYPAEPKNANINTIPHMSELFDLHVGLSDHTLGIGVAVASVALGARVIEKHFTLDRSEGGVDADFSMEPSEFKLLVEESKRAFQSLGKINYVPTEKELKSKIFKRSLIVSEDVAAGEEFTEKNIRVLRPGIGLAPKYFDIFMGRKSARDLKKGTPVNWDILG
jgi:N-acetylneuraminate synthase